MINIVFKFNRRRAVFLLFHLFLFLSSGFLIGENKIYTGEPRTIAHDFLNLEKDFGAGEAHYRYVNALINKARSKIVTKKNYTTEEAVALLRAIDSLLRDEGFVFKNNYLLFSGIDNKVIDCDNYCTIYTSISEILKIPVIPVYAPNHSFVRFNFNDGTYLNWETTEGKPYPDAFYIKQLNISNVSIEKQVYMRSLTRKEFIAVEYNNLGSHLMNKKDYKDAIPYFSMGIKLYPNFSSAYHNRGTCFYALKRINEAFADLTKAVSLDPTRASTRNTLGDIYFDLEKYSEAIEEYKESIRLEPQNYVPYYSIGMIMKQMGKTAEANKWLKRSQAIKKKYSN